MAIVLIGGIGATQQNKTTYVFDDAQEPRSESEYFLEVLAKRISPEKVMVIMTEEARTLHLDELRKRLQDICPVEPIDIPRGAKEEEVWQMFTTIVGKLPADVELVLDITSGFRYIPMLMLLASAYERTLRLNKAQEHLVVREIYYGAFDAVDKRDDPKPVFKFGAFASLLEWIGAVDTFVRTGQGSALATLVLSKQDQLPKELKNLATTLKNLSLALDLVRPVEAMQKAHLLMTQMRKISDEAKTTPSAIAPFIELLADLRVFDQFALEAPRSTQPRDVLRKMRQLLRWYVDHERFADASLLAREWVLSWYMMNQHGVGVGAIFDREQRKTAENEIKDNPRWQGSSLWENVRIVRNNIAHASFLVEEGSLRNYSSTTIAGKIRDIVKQIETVSLD